MSISANARKVCLQGEIVALAEEGGVQPRSLYEKFKIIELRNLNLTERGREILSGGDYSEVLNGRKFEIEIPNSKGPPTTFRGCVASAAEDHWNKPTDRPLPGAQFYVLEQDA